MQINTFKKDLFGLDTFSERLYEFIKTERLFVEDSLVLAITSKYGSGKSTFLEMWKNALEDENNPEQPLVVSLNAWVSDFYGDPLFAIVSELVDSLDKKAKKSKPLIDAANKLSRFGLLAGNQVISKFSGVDIIAAAEYSGKVEGKKEIAINLNSDAFSIFNERKRAMQELKNAIENVVSQNNGKVLFLVDELDRCRPDYAINYLEVIKHIFDIKGAVFILAYDRNQLENSALTAFGRDLDFNEYIRKFVHREIALPPLSNQGCKKIFQEYFNYYLEREGTRYCYLDFDYNRKDELTKLTLKLNLTPRQIQEIFRILGHMLGTSKEYRAGMYNWAKGVGAILMITLRYGDSDLYNKIATASLEPLDALHFLSNTFGQDSQSLSWWLAILYSGKGIKYNSDESFEDVVNKLDNIKLRKHINSIQEFYEAWGSNYNDTSHFNNLYHDIELLEDLIK